MIPPFWFLDGLGLVWRLPMFTPATMTLPEARSTSCTLPRLPRSRPAMTTTSSPLRMRRLLATTAPAQSLGYAEETRSGLAGLARPGKAGSRSSSYALRRDRDDLHEL